MDKMNVLKPCICSMNCAKPVTHFCSYESPETYLCLDHVVNHLKSSTMVHDVLPIAAFGQHRIPGYGERLKRRGEVREAATLQLQSSVKTVDDCISEVESIANSLVLEVRAWAKRNIQELNETKDRLQTGITATIAEAERVFYEDTPTHILPATATFREFQPDLRGLALFAYRMTPCPIAQLLSETLSMSDKLGAAFNCGDDAVAPKPKEIETGREPAACEFGEVRGPVRMDDGSVYVGEWKGEKRFGKGRLFRVDGGLQDGYWDGELQKEGRCIYPNGDYYEGGFYQELKQGRGCQDLGIAGDFDPSTMTVEAKQKEAEKGPFVHKAEFESGKRMNPMRLSDGSVYVGEWKEAKRFGKGRLFTSDGGLQEGCWDEDLHREGRCISPNGDYYEGGMYKGVRQGRGRFEDFTGMVYYDGEWLNGAKHGFGTEHTQDGSEYMGCFENDDKSGQGLIKCPSGESYCGAFLSNAIHGRGKYVWSDRKWYDGDWVEGRMQGKGRLIEDGKDYEGDFFQGVKHGVGVLQWDGNLYEGEWRNGQMCGIGYLTMKGKERKRVLFEDNEKALSGFQ